MIFINRKLYQGGGVIALWTLLSFFYDSIILPSPLEVLFSLYNIVVSSDFVITLTSTFTSLTIGLSIGIGLGLIVGVLLGINLRIRELIYPFIVFLQAAPVISFILLALIWFSPEFIPIFILSINTFPNLTINLIEGIDAIDKKLLEMSDFYKVPKKKQIINLYIPSVFSNISAALRVILANALKVTVMAEVISKSSKGIGSKINWAWINIETSDILAWTFIIILLSILLEKKVLTYLIERMEKSYDKDR